MRKRLLALGLAGIMAASAALTGCSGSNGTAETKVKQPRQRDLRAENSNYLLERFYGF